MRPMTRRILWFATGYTIVIIVHEGAHAITAYGLGLEATLFNFWVNIDPANQATAAQRAAYGVAGPIAGLVAGRDSEAGAPKGRRLFLWGGTPVASACWRKSNSPKTAFRPKADATNGRCSIAKTEPGGLK